MSLTRRQLVGGCAALTASSSLLLARAQDAKKLRLNLLPITEVSPVFAGIKLGFFREAGLDPVVTPSSGGAAGIPGLVGGAFDVIYTNPVSALLAISRGLDLRALATSTAMVRGSNGVFARKGEGLKAGKAMEGKSIAVNTRSNSIWLFAHEWIRETGGDPDKVQFKEVPFPQMADAVRQKQVDAALSTAPFFPLAAQDPAFEVIGYPFDLQPQHQPGLYLCSGRAIKESPELVNGFLAALKRSNAWYDQNIASRELDQIIANYTKLPVETVASIKRGQALNALSVTELGKTMQLMVSAKLLDKPIDLNRILHSV